jgi:hypothetical protein
MSQERTTWRRNKPPSTSTKPVFRLTAEQATHWLGQRRARAATDALHAWNVVMSHHPDGRALADLSDAQLRWWGVEDEEERVAVLEEISGYQADILESQSSLLAGDLPDIPEHKPQTCLLAARTRAQSLKPKA